MRDVGEEGRTVLFVSHNMAAVTQLCSKAIYLDKGEIIDFGIPEDIIGHYLRKTDNFSASWHPDLIDKDSPIHLISVSIKDIDGNARATFTNIEPIQIEFHIFIKDWISRLKIGFEIETELGMQVFTVFHNDRNEILDKELFKEGKYIFRAFLPKEIFNSTQYYVTPCAGEHRVQWFFRYERAISFNVNFQVGNPECYVGKRPGAIAPIFDWTCEKV
jgi:lipopolysaccharide transport system ATP-binding protein